MNKHCLKRRKYIEEKKTPEAYRLSRTLNKLIKKSETFFKIIKMAFIYK